MGISKRVVGYIRVSTKTQVREGLGLDVQREEIVKYCNANNFELIKIYEDAGISGADADEGDLTIDREGLQEMLADLPTLKPDYVLVLNTSRLWRSDLVKVLIQRQLKKYKVDVKSIEQATYSIYNNDDPTNFLVNGMLELLDQYQRLEIALKLRRARIKKAKGGGFAGYRRPLGYKKDTDKHKDLIPDENRETIKKIFYLAKRKKISLNQIAKILNSEGIPTKTGGRWWAGTVRYILNNKIYKGKLGFNGIETTREDLKII